MLLIGCVSIRGPAPCPEKGRLTWICEPEDSSLHIWHILLHLTEFAASQATAECNEVVRPMPYFPVAILGSTYTHSHTADWRNSTRPSGQSRQSNLSIYLHTHTHHCTFGFTRSSHICFSSRRVRSDQVQEKTWFRFRDRRSTNLWSRKEIEQTTNLYSRGWQVGTPGAREHGTCNVLRCYHSARLFILSISVHICRHMITPG